MRFQKQIKSILNQPNDVLGRHLVLLSQVFEHLATLSIPLTFLLLVKL